MMAWREPAPAVAPALAVEGLLANRSVQEDRFRMKTVTINVPTAPICTLLAAVLVGCSGGKPARVTLPDYDIPVISKKAIELNDKDGDGALSGEELDGVKSLKSGMSRLDADKDGKLTADEVAKRLQRYIDFKIGLAPVDCTVTKGGRPLAGATITYEPEEFMGDSLPPGTGTTGAEGITAISIAKDLLPTPNHSGVKPGFYRVKVKLADGTEASNLDAGVECAGDFQSSHRIIVP
jgi:hypothetical protein